MIRCICDNGEFKSLTGKPGLSSMNRGRTAPVCAESSVYKRRFISICLLACYGLPASLGPGWHRHDHACNHLIADACEQRADDEQDRKDHCCCQVSCKSPAGESQENPENASPFDHQIGAQHDHGPCLICDFYSQAQCCTCGDLQVVSGLLVTVPPQSAQQAVALEPFSGKARGPPGRA